MTDHFQTVLTEIQAQIELHSSRNDKLCGENANLTDRLESLMSQCEQREAVRAEVKGQGPADRRLTLASSLCRVWTSWTGTASCRAS